MAKPRHTLLSKLVMLAIMTSLVAVAASAQTQFVRNGDFIISENLNVSGDSNFTGGLTVGGIITGDGSGITNVMADIDANNDSMLFGNITRLDNRIDDINTSIQNLNATSTTDEIQNVFTNIGTDAGNVTVTDSTTAVSIEGQAGGTTTSSSGNIITVALSAINSVITNFVNAVTFQNDVTVLGDINTNGTVNASSFIGDGSQLTGVIASNATFAVNSNFADNATFADTASSATTAGSADNATYAALAGNASFAAAVNCEDIIGTGGDSDFCNDQDGDDSDWANDGNQAIYNVSASVGIGTSEPAARLDVIESNRLGADGNNNSFYQKDTIELSAVSGFTTVLTVEASTLTDVETEWTVNSRVQGNTATEGNGVLNSMWTVGISGGAYTLTNVMEDKVNSHPEFRLTSSGNIVNLQVDGHKGNGALNGFGTFEINPSSGAGANGATVLYTVNRP